MTIKKSEPVEMMDSNGNFICKFTTLRHAADFLVEHGHSKSIENAKSGISAAIAGKITETYKKFRWKYVSMEQLNNL